VTRLAVTVVICAYTEERFEYLRAAVLSIELQTYPAHDIVIVIDHNERLFDRALSSFPNATVIRNEGTKGLSGARNTGTCQANGNIIAFLDDDAEAYLDWLERLANAYVGSHLLGVGGFIEPRWLSRRPRWFPSEFYWVVGCSYRGLPESPAALRNLIGANMSVRRDVLAKLGGFTAEFGRVGARPSGVEDTEFCIRARQRWPERDFLYEPRARVRHNVPASRTRFNYFRMHCFNEGYAKAFMSRLVGKQDGLQAERNYVRQTLPRAVLRGLMDTLIRGDVSGIARAAAVISGLAFTMAGYIVGTITRPQAVPGADQSGTSKSSPLSEPIEHKGVWR